MSNNTTIENFLGADILDRFLRYVRLHTTSDRHSSTSPTTEGQWELIRLLETELGAIGVRDIEVTESGFLVARLPSNQPGARATVGFLAHVDTAADVSGKDVRPVVTADYDGGPIALAGGTLDPAEFPALRGYKGDTIISSDANTLLGADDKAGVAEIMAAAAYLMSNPDLPRPNLELIFTPDEETGKGMDRFPLDRIRSTACYTLDGDGEGTVEDSCFNAHRATIRFSGRVIHLGQARGRFANALAMAGYYMGLLPRSESPEATDGDFGYYCPVEAKGDLGTAVLEVFIRDFETSGIERRIRALKAFAAATEAAFPGGSVQVESRKQYLNMADAVAKRPEVLEMLDEAIRGVGIQPRHEAIRGGTDGARLTEMGIPTPNIFAGGRNFHSRFEWVPLSSMVKAAWAVVNLVGLWAEAGRADKL